jgi:hypothetical protein
MHESVHIINRAAEVKWWEFKDRAHISVSGNHLEGRRASDWHCNLTAQTWVKLQLFEDICH